MRLPSLHRRRGVTLVEMLIVVTVLGLAAAITYSRIDATPQQLRGEMQVVGTTLIAAQREALGKQHNIIVVFDTTQSELRIILDANNNRIHDEGERVRTVPLGERIGFGRASAPARPFGDNTLNFTSASGGLPAIIFSRNGAASTGGGFYLSSRRALADPAAHPYETQGIAIERATGAIDWWTYAGGEWRRIQ